MFIPDLHDTMVPISRFNKGEAAKVFEEVQRNKVKVAVKNNTPACYLVSPEEYSRIAEIMEDYALLSEALKRKQNPAPSISHKDVLKHFGYTESDLEQVEVELE